MAQVLAITANPKGEKESVSKQMLHAFIDSYKKKNPNDTVEILDLYKEKIHELNEQYIGVVYMRKDAAQTNAETKALLKTSDMLINKVTAADKIIVVVPMWNFSVPPVFKMFIDLIIFPGKTFKFNGPGMFEGLLKGKKVLVLGARGGVYTEEPYKAYDLEEPWLRNVFGFMGITDFQTIWAQGTNYFQGKELENAITGAFKEAANKAESF